MKKDSYATYATYPTSVVSDYYDKCYWHYKMFWTDSESLAIHYGFWESDTKSKKESLINQYKEMLAALDISSKDLVLDAGCGVGGASFWLAEKTGAKVVGITISEKQLKAAKKILKSKKNNLVERVDFQKRDYFNTGFQDEKFNKIFGIESFCYSYPNPENLFKEMFRILKKGGKFFMSDGILLRYPENDEEKEIVDKFFLGWRLSGGNVPEEILKALRKCGFKNARYINKTEQIKKNKNLIYWRGAIAHPILRLFGFFGLVSDVQSEHGYATINQKKLIDRGIMGYGIFYAEK